MVCLPLAEIHQRGTLFRNTAFSVQCKRSDCWRGDRFSDCTAGIPVPGKKRASKVSPVTAISGSSQLTQNKRAANTKLFHIETSMGIFHALSGKKNVFLMTCSFAISIMMFLSFQVMVVFLNQGMPALSPSAADVSVTMGNTPLDKSLVEQISETEGVDKVFGRMEMAGLSVSSDVGEGTITLISYDDNQFGWGERRIE